MGTEDHYDKDTNEAKDSCIMQFGKNIDTLCILSIDEKNHILIDEVARRTMLILYKWVILKWTWFREGVLSLYYINRKYI